MRLRELMPAEREQVEDLRGRVLRNLLAGTPTASHPEVIARVLDAPFLDKWEIRRHRQTGEPCLHGLCWGHPAHGDQIVTTSAIASSGPGYVRTASGRLYLLGREDRAQRKARYRADAGIAPSEPRP